MSDTLFIPMHAELATHPKFNKTVRSLGIEPEALIGHLYNLWTWCMTHAPDGRLEGIDAEDIALAFKWQGDAEELLKVLINHKWLDAETGTLVVHNWEKYGGMLFENRKKWAADKAAWRASKLKKGDVSKTSLHCPSDVSKTSQRCLKDVSKMSSLNINSNINITETGQEKEQENCPSAKNASGLHTDIARQDEKKEPVSSIGDTPLFYQGEPIFAPAEEEQGIAEERDAPAAENAAETHKKASLTSSEVKRPNRTTYSPEFREIWEFYSKANSGGKLDAQKQYVARIRSGLTHVELKRIAENALAQDALTPWKAPRMLKTVFGAAQWEELLEFSAGEASNVVQLPAVSSNGHYRRSAAMQAELEKRYPNLSPAPTNGDCDFAVKALRADSYWHRPTTDDPWDIPESVVAEAEAYEKKLAGVHYRALA